MEVEQEKIEQEAQLIFSQREEMAQEIFPELQGLEAIKAMEERRKKYQKEKWRTFGNHFAKLRENNFSEDSD